MKHPIIERIQQLLRAHWWRVLSGVLGVLLLVQLVSWGSMLLDFNRINRLIAQAEDLQAPPKDEGNESNQNQNQPKQPSKNIFKKMEVKYQLTAILMDYAIINGQNVKLGGKVGKAEVTEIANHYVVIQEEEKDQPTTLSMFNSGGGGGGGSRPRSAPPRRSRPNRNQPKKAAAAPPPAPAPQVQAMELPQGVQINGGAVFMTEGVVLDGQNVQIRRAPGR